MRRVINYYYQSGAPDNTVIHDKAANSVLHIRHQRVLRKGEFETGWVDLSLPVETIDVMHANEFAADGALMWSSKGGFNNGHGLYYVIKTTDEVISASVTRLGNKDVVLAGGYQYEHDDNGRLITVISLSANDGGVYHVTYYNYGEFGLLLSEQKVVTGQSLFNSAADEEVEYEYTGLDHYGNWTSRTVTHFSKLKTERYVQQRVISYY